jgi:ABC-type transport system substrate-binding protein
LQRSSIRRSVGLLALALAALTISSCSDDTDSGSSGSDLISKAACTPGTGVAVKLPTGEVGSDEAPKVSEVAEPAGVARKGGSPDTLVDLQNFSAGEPDHIDPATADTLQGAQIPVLLYDGLTDTDYDGKVIPKVAESWTVSDDAKTFVFTLKKGQTFANGEAITPTTFKKSWERALNPKLASAVAYHMFPIVGAQEMVDGKATELKGVTADDAANTLTVNLTGPFADYAAVVSHPVFSPVPKEAYEAKDLTKWEQGPMIGNGPYTMTEAWKHNEEVNLVRNDNYTSGDKAKIQNLNFVISKDQDAAHNAFLAGKGDTSYIPSGQFTEATKKFKSVTDLYDGVYKFEIGQDNPCLGGPNNLKLRQAISLAIDRDRINKQVYNDSRLTASGLTPPGVDGFKSGLCETCKYDPKRAKELVKEWKAAGGHLNEPIKIGTNTGAGHEPVVSIMVENLKAIGIPAKLDGLNPDTWTDDLRKAKGCQLCRSGWVWDYPIYDNVLSSQYLSAGIGSDNWARFDSKEFDKAIADARATTDAAERQNKYRQAEKMLMDNAISIPLNWYRGNVVYDNRVQGLRISPLSFFSYEEASLTS